MGERSSFVLFPSFTLPCAPAVFPDLWEAQNRGHESRSPTEGAQGRGTDSPTTPSAVTLVWTKHGGCWAEEQNLPESGRAVGWGWKQGFDIQQRLAG